MKFSCNQQVLSKALNIVSKAVTSRTTIPILKGILLKVNEDGTLIMAASDLDLSIERKLDVQNFEAGEIVVEAKLFSDIIRKLPNDNINIEVIDGNINIKCSNSEFNIVASPSDEFPKINDELKDDDDIIFGREVFKELVRKTTFAASVDDARGVITGVLLELNKNSVNMVALDGFRMAIARENISNEVENKSVIIPAKIINEVAKIVTETEIEDLEEVKLNINDKKATFIIEKTKATLKLLDGEFVKYNDILPKESQTRVVLNRGDFLNSIERASLLSKVGKNNLIKLNITDNTIEITSKSEEGNVTENVICSKEGSDIVIGFNSKYLIDAIKIIDDEEIVMLFNTNISPCLIEPMEGNEFEYLILPVRITNG